MWILNIFVYFFDMATGRQLEVEDPEYYCLVCWVDIP